MHNASAESYLRGIFMPLQKNKINFQKPIDNTEHLCYTKLTKENEHIFGYKNGG